MRRQYFQRASENGPCGSSPATARASSASARICWLLNVKSYARLVTALRMLVFMNKRETPGRLQADGYAWSVGWERGALLPPPRNAARQSDSVKHFRCVRSWFSRIR